MSQLQRKESNFYYWSFSNQCLFGFVAQNESSGCDGTVCDLFEGVGKWAGSDGFFGKMLAEEFAQFGAGHGVGDMPRALEEELGDHDSDDVAVVVEERTARVSGLDRDGNLPGRGIVAVACKTGNFTFVEFRGNALMLDVGEPDCEDRRAEFDLGIEAQRCGGDFSGFDF